MLRHFSLAAFTLLLMSVSRSVFPQIPEVPKPAPRAEQAASERAGDHQNERSRGTFRDLPSHVTTKVTPNQSAEEKSSANGGEEAEKPDGPDPGEVDENAPVNAWALGLAVVFVGMVLGLGIWGKKKYYKS